MAVLIVVAVAALVGVWAVRHDKAGTEGIGGIGLASAVAATAPESATNRLPDDPKSSQWLKPATQAALPPVTKPDSVVSAPPGVPQPAAAPNVSSGVPPITAGAGLSAAQLAEEGDRLAAAERKDKARESYLAALAAAPPESLRAKLEEKLGLLNVELVTHPWPMPEKQDCVVREGDSIKALARKYGTTVELIVKANELKRPDVIRPGQRIKVFGAKMEIRVSKGRNDLLLTAGGRFFKRYRVGTGRYDKTPVGTFVISERIPEPPWWRDDGKIVPFGDKDNILGTRWMAIKATGNTPEIKGYGIHGTWDNASIGKAESAGCIRLSNADVEELFQLVPVGTPVSIEE